MNQRSVTIKGQPKHVALACLKIYQTLEKYAYSVEDIEKKAVILNIKLKIFIGTNLER